MKRLLYIKVGDEAVRGPLDEDAVRASFASGVLAPSTLAGEEADALRPIAEVLAAAASPAGKSKRTGSALAIGAAVLLALGGIGSGIAYYVQHRPPALCTGTGSVLARIDSGKTLTITLYVSPTKSPRFAAARRDVEGLLGRMKEEGQGKIVTRIVEVRDELGAKEALEAGLQKVLFADGNDESGSGAGYFGLVLTYGTQKDKIPLATSDSDISITEYFIANKVREITARDDGRQQHIALVAGHGGVQLGDKNLVPPTGGMGGPSVRGIVEQYFPFYRIEDTDLRTAPIPSEARGVLVTQPDQPFDDAELAKIDEHVMRGGSLAIVASAAHTALGDPSLGVKLATRGLEKLTNGYGLELARDLIFDQTSRFRVRVDLSGAPTTMGFEWIPVVKAGSGLDASSVAFFKLTEVSFPLASSLTLHEDRQPGAKFRVLAKTSGDGVRDRRDTIELGLTKQAAAEGEHGSFIIAASVEGTLTSAFGKGRSAKPARVLVIASSAFLANPFVRVGEDERARTLASPYVQTFGTSTVLIVKNIFDWLAWDDDLAGCFPPSTKPR